MSERAPLLHYRLTAGEPEVKDVSRPSEARQLGDGWRDRERPARKLGVVFGVVIPTLLSMFSVVVFLRIGEYKRSRNKNKYEGSKISIKKSRKAATLTGNHE